ncbi:ribonuclease H protein [Trifolium medium]|uniref:Ribonuclease H protein n=1 Tax=Trifolium medium TaxID=97028 RepID=A0A392N7D2_9FABA|nr:ribonuclease H protein [Trifolium medium]
MSVKVWREVVKIQRNFLWGWLSNRRRICWVKWTDICRPKREGGLGIRDLRVMNTSLLAKWRWNLLMEGDEVWRRVVVVKYGDDVVGNACLDVEDFRYGASVWWRDICRLDGGQEAVVRDMGRWENGVWRWGLLWRRDFFVWEEFFVQQLLNVISQKNLTEVDDSWGWSPAIEDEFLVKSLYVFLETTLSNHVQRTDLESFAFRYIWKSGVPSKASALVWQLLLERIPTRDNLCYRGVIRHEEVSGTL